MNIVVDKSKCQVGILVNYKFRQCRRKIWKNGYCKQHHPDTVKKRREESNRRYEEKRTHEPWYVLQKARERIAALEAENATLRRAQPDMAKSVGSGIGETS